MFDFIYCVNIQVKTAQSRKFFSLLSQDFVFGLSIILRGTINDRLNWAFNLYDLNKDGCITKEVIYTWLCYTGFCELLALMSLFYFEFITESRKKVILKNTLFTQKSSEDIWKSTVTRQWLFFPFPRTLCRRCWTSWSPSMTWWGSTHTPLCRTMHRENTWRASSRSNAAIFSDSLKEQKCWCYLPCSLDQPNKSVFFLYFHFRKWTGIKMGWSP